MTRSSAPERSLPKPKMGVVTNGMTPSCRGGARIAWRTESSLQETKERAASSPIVSSLGSRECRFSGETMEAMDMGGEQGSRSMRIRSRKEPCTSNRLAPLHRSARAVMRGRLTMNADAAGHRPATISEAG